MKPRMRRSLLGFDPAAVNQAIEKRMQSHAEEVAVLQSALQAELAEQEQLQDRIRWTEERLNRQQTLISQLEASRRQAETASPLMYELIQRQIREMDASAERERQALIQQLNRLNDRIGQVRKQMAQWLDQAGQLVAAIEGEMATVAVERKDEAAAANVGRVLPFRTTREPDAGPRDRLPVPPPATPAPAEEAGWRPGVPSGDTDVAAAPAVAGSEVGTPVPAAESRPAAPLLPALLAGAGQAAAPGTVPDPQRPAVAGDVRQPVIDAPAPAVAAEPSVADAPPPAAAAPPPWKAPAPPAASAPFRPGVSPATSSPFTSAATSPGAGPSTGGLFRTAGSPPLVPATPVSSSPPALATPVPAAPAVPPPIAPSPGSVPPVVPPLSPPAPLATAAATTPPAPAPTAAAPPAAPASAAPPPAPAPVAPPAFPAASTAETGQMSSGLQARIDARMLRFMQGKVVGMDLTGATGNLIAAKGAAITPAIIEQAQRDGVLPELILHMTWPEETRS